MALQPLSKMPLNFRQETDGLIIIIQCASRSQKHNSFFRRFDKITDSAGNVFSLRNNIRTSAHYARRKSHIRDVANA